MEKTAKKIQMVDLKSQYEKIKLEVDMAIQNVLNTTAFINGPEVKSFQAELEEYLKVKHVIPCANGTDALQIAVRKLHKPQAFSILYKSLYEWLFCGLSL